MASVSTPDLCVIGAGPSGLAVAEAARRLGASVAVVEKGEPGGSLKWSTLALRALLAASDRAGLAARAEPFGVLTDPPRISFRRLHDHIAEVVAAAAVQSGAPRLASLGIELIRGTGSFTDTRTVVAGDTRIQARRFVIATGAHSVIPEIPGLFSVPHFTTETIFDNTRKLSHLVVVGAGPMGLELALAYRRLGADVTIVDAGRALVQSDPELAEIALRRLRDEGVTLHQDSSVIAVHARSQGIGVSMRAGDEMLSLDVSHILIAAGRTASLDELNLDAAKVRRAKSDPGALSLNTSLRTTNPKVFAVGEAAGHSAHLNRPEADLVVRAALLGQPARYDPAAVPRLTLTDPPIAEIGLSEPMVRGRFRSGFAVYRASYAENDAARAGRDGMGVAKLVVNRAGKILGAGVVGAGAAELAALLALAMEQDIPAAKLADFAAPHPSFADLARALGEQAATAAGPSPWQRRRLALYRRLP